MHIFFILQEAHGPPNVVIFTGFNVEEMVSSRNFILKIKVKVLLA